MRCTACHQYTGSEIYLSAVWYTAARARVRFRAGAKVRVYVSVRLRLKELHTRKLLWHSTAWQNQTDTDAVVHAEKTEIYMLKTKEVFLLAHWIMGCLLGC